MKTRKHQDATIIIHRHLNGSKRGGMGYDAADNLRRVDGLPVGRVQIGRSAESVDRDRLINVSRAMFRNNSIYRGIINHMVNYIVGRGISLQPQSDDNDWNRAATKQWAKFWRRPEVRDMWSGKRLIEHVCRELLITGEIWLLYTDLKKVQMLQSEQIVPFLSNYDAGVRTNRYGKPTVYNVAPISDTGQIARYEAKPVPAASMIAAYMAEDPSSLRGMPPGQSSFEMLYRLEDICDSEAQAWHVLSQIALTINREGGPDAAYGEAGAQGADAGSGVDGSDFQITEFDKGMVFQGGIGDIIHGIDRNIPGKDFPESVRMFLRLIGLPFGIPLEIVLLDWTQSNYSQSRAVLEQAHETFEDFQTLIADAILAPLYRRKLSEWLADGTLPAANSSPDHTWIMPPFPWIDPEKEGKAQAQLIELGLDSYNAALQRRGESADAIMRQNVSDVIDAITAAKQVEDGTGVKVPWQYFAGRNLPTGAILSADEANNTDDDDEGGVTDEADNDGNE